jgi:hypothetical protein
MIMHPKLRTCIAYVAGRLISGREASSIYDNLQSKIICIEGQVTAENVKIFDQDRGCYLSGLGDGKAFELYDFGGMYYVELIIDGNSFEGYDHGTPSLFKGEIKGDEITVYDDGESKYFSFVLK